MNLKGLKTLEYEKIISLLSEQAGSQLGKSIIERLRPSSDYDEISEWLAETDEGCMVLQAGMSAPLGGIRDIRLLLKKAKVGAVLEPYELLDVVSCLYAMRQVKRFFKEIDIVVPLLQTKAHNLEILGQLENLLNQIVDEHGAMRDNASSELLRIRRGIRQSQRQVKDKLDSILHSTEYQKFFQDNLVTMRGDRYVIPIKQEYRQSFPGIVHDQSSTGATLFIEPMAVVNLNNEIKQLAAAEKHEIMHILRNAAEKIMKNEAVLQDNCQILGQLDFIFAKARLSQKLDAVKPLLNRDGYVELLQARHPLINADKVVPISLTLGREFKTLLITGPNTGGKTVSMKTLGLLALMTQSGLFIPAMSGSQMTIFRQVYADIGDEQSIEQSLSTFSAHMTHLVKILAEVEEDDLLLIDEIGSGTDPEEGAALAMSILEHLMKIGTRVVATTHYSELKTFAYSHDNIENASVEFDIATLRPTYRLLIGIPGTSNAFSISKRLGLADSLIIRARQLIDADHAQFEKILNHLESEKLMYEQRNADMMEREQQIKAMERKIARQRSEMAEKKDKMLLKAREDSAGLLRRTRREAEAVITQLKEQFNDHGIRKRQEAIENARNKIKSGMSDVQIEQKKNYRQEMKPVNKGELAPGDIIYVTTLDQKGEVAAVNGKDIQVQLGAMKMNVPLKACMFVSKAKQEPKTQNGTGKKKQKKNLGFMKVQEIQRQIDIRGMLVDEAEEVLGKYIDDAVLAGMTQILVIHGKGTGALRKGVRAYLAQHRNVLSAAMADMNEGGDGATVVELQ